MSDLWKIRGDGPTIPAFALEPASPADLLAELCRGVESGTIKGEVVDWCEAHRASVVETLGGCGAEDPKDCRVTRRVLLPPETTYKTYLSAEGAEVTYAP